MRIRKVTIRNFRAIDSLELPLHPELTVLLGPNRCGKTSVLRAIARVAEMCFGRLRGDPPLAADPEDFRVGEGEPLVELLIGDTRTISIRGNRQKKTWETPRDQVLLPLEPTGDIWTDPPEMNLAVFYGTERAIDPVPQLDSELLRAELQRVGAFDDAFILNADFRKLLEWFQIREYQEFTEQRDRRDHDFRLPDLSAVRDAICAMLDGVSNPRFRFDPWRFVVDELATNGDRRELSLNQLSGGYRMVLGLAGDLAWRLAQAYPEQPAPLDSPMVALIDEIELHLHPAWQQRILEDLRRTFPNAQFVVSTHSPQVLSTVKPDQIVALERDGDRIVPGPPEGPTYGAASGDVLSRVMGVEQRPENEFRKTLDAYWRLIDEGQGEGPEARRLRERLDALSPEDRGLRRADIELRRQRAFGEIGGTA